MQMKRWKQTLSMLVCCVLIAATALCTTGCSGSTQSTSSSAVTSEAAASEAPVSEAATADTAQAAVTELGQGATAFAFTVVDGDGNETVYEIHTDKTTVGDALVELGLIDGEDSEYGLYVKTVNGITVDYDTDGKYWAFYADGEYSQTGVDSTEITPNGSYAFKVEE